MHKYISDKVMKLLYIFFSVFVNSLRASRARVFQLERLATNKNEKIGSWTIVYKLLRKHVQLFLCSCSSRFSHECNSRKPFSLVEAAAKQQQATTNLMENGDYLGSFNFQLLVARAELLRKNTEVELNLD